MRKDIDRLLAQAGEFLEDEDLERVRAPLGELERAWDVLAEAKRAKALAFENTERAMRRVRPDAESIAELLRAADDLALVLDVLDRADEHVRRSEGLLEDAGES